MNIKNAGKAKTKKDAGKIPSKETVDTPISECEAKNPLECKYHGVQTLENMLNEILPSLGDKKVGGISKAKGGYAVTIKNTANPSPSFLEPLIDKFEKLGWKFSFIWGDEDEDGHFSITKLDKESAPKTKDEDEIADIFFSDLEQMILEDDLSVDEGDNEGDVKEEEKTEENIGGFGVTKEDIEDFLLKGGLTPSHVGPETINNWANLLANGKFVDGTLLKDKDILETVKAFMSTAGKEHKVSKAFKAKIAEVTGKSPKQEEEIAALSDDDMEALEMLEAEDMIESEAEAIKDMWEYVEAKKESKKGKKDKEVIPSQPSYMELGENLLKPLEHDESKFPANITQEQLDGAIAKGKSAGGHGGLHTTIVKIGDKKYICKYGAGKKANIIKNGFNADMAYRAGGIYAPDAKLYDFGDGKTYKLSEFIEGERLIDVWKDASEKQREEIRKELLKGFPLDVLFSNYDVLGTSPEESQTVAITDTNGEIRKTHVAFDNIMMGKDGHAYRIDNDGAFAMTGTGGHKSSNAGSYTTPVQAEQWENWDERQWIDDFRTMRRNEKNVGIFDRYSTADIFTAAGDINFDKAVEGLPKPLKEALAKPLFEMKQMTYRAVNIALGGFKNNKFVSMALDASYEASKRGLREQCKVDVAWNNPGFGAYKEYWGNYQPQPFNEKQPEPPENPTTILDNKYKNEEYTGSKIGETILNAAKTINHHGGVKQTDAYGNVLGNGTAQSTPDYIPNATKIAEWEKIDREKLEELAKTDGNAKTLLGLYDTIVYSKENGWKKPIGQIPIGLVIEGKLPANFKSPTETKILEDMASAIEEFKVKERKYRKALAEYEERKSTHMKREEEKAKRAGGSPYHNFHHFANALMEEGINTDGIAHKIKTNGIAPIEDSMSAQKGSSYSDCAVKWKVREMMALGYSPEEILKMANAKSLYNGDYYKKCIDTYLLPHKEEWDRDMNSQAMYLGLNALKMENEHSDLYDKASGVVFLNRNIASTPKGLSAKEKAIYTSSSAMGWVGPHIDSAADCMQFEKNSWSGDKKQVYAVPFSRIVCCANNEQANSGGYGYNSEQEYVGNLYNLPCWVYHGSNNLTWKNAIDKAKESEGMSNFLKAFAKRLSAFNTLTK